jgi:hypothetical protein
MAGSLSDYLENKLLDHIVGKTTYSKPTAYVALSTADPTDDGSGMAEPSGNGYARVATAGGDWNAAASGSISNVNDIEFPEATGAWGTITHFAIYDAATNGNLLAHGSLGSSEAITSGKTAKFAGGTPGDIVITQS